MRSGFCLSLPLFAAAAMVARTPSVEGSGPHVVQGLLERVARLEVVASPVGSVTAWLGSELPEGWLECNGQQLPVHGHEQLAARLGGGKAGVIDLPDLTGRFLRGVGKDSTAPGALQDADGWRITEVLREESQVNDLRRLDRVVLPESGGFSPKLATGDGSARHNGIWFHVHAGEQRPANEAVRWIIRVR